jgi:hypothetical protein
MRRFHTFLIAAFLFLGMSLDARATTIDFDDPTLDHLDDITNFYAAMGVTFDGIANPFPIGPGPCPAPATVPAILGGAAIWDPGTSPGESAPNFAAGLGQGEPGDGGILMSFAFDVNSVSVTGLDFGNGMGDTEQMTLTAYDASGAILGQVHNTSQFALGAIFGTISLPGMRYVAFNYTNTQYGFYGIDDLTFEREATPAPEPGSLSLIGLALAVLSFMRKPRPLA